MKRLIINADDFGYSSAVNAGIIKSYRQGLLTSTTIMPAMPGFDEAVGLAAEHRGLGVGVHLTLTCGRPLVQGHRTLVMDNGCFPRKPFYEDPDTRIDLDEVEREWTEQIERVLRAGIAPDHLDSHHHIHIFKGVREVLYELARRYDLPIRNSWNPGGQYDGPEQTIPEDLRAPDVLIDFVKPAGVRYADSPVTYREQIGESFRACIAKELAEHDVVEVMSHPAFVDFALATGSSFNVARTAETEVLCDARNRAFIEGLEDVQLVSYRTLYGLSR